MRELLRRAGLPTTAPAIGAATALESVLVEHEDPTLIAQLLAELGLAGSGTTSLLGALKRELEAGETEGRTWARRSNASTS